jgi:uncharacterized protein (DUF362 family)
MSVAVIKWEGRATVNRAIEAVNGWNAFRPGMKVLVKPNAVMGGSAKIPCRGITTSAEILGEVVHLARQRGAASVVIAEGSVELPTLKLDTAAAFQWSGIQSLADRESIPLIDMNKGPFRAFTLSDGTPIEIAEAVLDADFVINIPVLKTHNQTVTTICLKNLKGCLSMAAKKACHMEADLNQAIAEFNRLIPCHLNLVDALTATEIGPTPTGKSDQVRDLGLLIAGQDRLQCDVVGSYLLGYPAAKVPHILNYAQLTGGSVALENIPIIGEDVSHYRMDLQYCSSWLEDLMEKFAVKGLRMPPYGNRLCSACGFNLWAGLYGFCRANQGLTVEGEAELCAGLDVSPSSKAKHAVLLGKCAIEANKELKDIVKVPGCPPDPAKVAEILTRALVGGPKAGSGT